MLFQIRPKHVLVCRNDALGDTILAFPACGMIKKYFPDVEISFLGRNYTKDVIKQCTHVDHFVNYDELANLNGQELKQFFQEKRIDTALLMRAEKNLAWFVKRSGIKYRVGNLHYQKHWFTCNRFASFGKSNSGLNEAQLDIKLLRPLGITELPTREELPNYYGITKPALADTWGKLLSESKFNLIIHPMMTGHEREWGTKNFSRLIDLLGEDNYRIFITGSPQEGDTLRPWLNTLSSSVIDLTGKLQMEELMAFIAHADGLVGGSTGPTHVAGAMGIYVLGLYTNRHTQDAGRWGPIGFKAETISCDNELVRTIPPEKVFDTIYKWKK